MFAINHEAVDLDLRYATADNLTGSPIYTHAVALLHPDAHSALERSADLASAMGYRIIVFDAYRPSIAQWRLWEALPDPKFIADPRAAGSTHSRGIAIDLTLADSTGKPLEMGTDFDEMCIQSYHGRLDLDREAHRNRAILLGIMTATGWEHQPYEWWHYNLPDPLVYQKKDDAETVARIMRI
ncbi:D-alanyl-D-alanine dipeptidase [Acidihalobacter prosperus]